MKEEPTAMSNVDLFETQASGSLELKVQCNSHIEYDVMAANRINSLSLQIPTCTIATK